MMFRMLVLQSLYNLSDVQIEYQVWDRATFTAICRSWVGGLHSPTARRCGCFREKLARAGLIETLFDRFDQHLTAKGYIARGRGRWWMRALCRCRSSATRARRTRQSARRDARGSGERKPAKNRQKDKDARWTKKHGRSFFGYKNHVNVDRRAQADPALCGDRRGRA